MDTRTLPPVRLRRRHRSLTSRVGAVALVVAVAGTLSACGGADDDTAAAAPARTSVEAPTAAEPAAPEFGLVSPADAARLATTAGVTVIDVRTPEEFAEGHIEGAEMIDFYASTFADDIAALDPAGTYLVYCRSGNRSGQTTALMAQLGIDRVYDLAGGVVAYSQQGLPLVR